MRIKNGKTSATSSISSGSCNDDNPCKCTAFAPRGENKSTIIPSSNDLTDCNLKCPESQPCISECKNCLAHKTNIHENSYDCKINGGTVRFIQRICVPNTCKQVCLKANVEPSTRISESVDSDKLSTKSGSNIDIEKENVERSTDQNHEKHIKEEKIQKAKETVVSNACFCQNSDIEQSYLTNNDELPAKQKGDDRKFKNKGVQHPSQILSPIVADQNYEIMYIEPEKKRSLENRPSSPLIRNCEPNVCKVCKNYITEHSQLVGNDVSSEKPKAADENNELLTLTEEKEAKDKVKMKKENKPETQEVLAKSPRSSSEIICYPNVCKICQNLIEQQSQLRENDKPSSAKQKDDFKNRDVEAQFTNQHFSTTDENRRAFKEKDKTLIGQSTNLEKLQLVYNDKPSTKLESGFKFKNEDIEHPSPNQSFIVAEQSHEVLTVTDLEARQKKKKKTRKVKNTPKKPTFSSIEFLIKRLEIFKNPQLTKEEIVKYGTRKRKWDSPSTGELPKFGFYGTTKKKLFKFGESGSGLKTTGEVQDFYKLRDCHLRAGTLFEDPEFPPIDSSLFHSKRLDRNIEWKRPGELVENPQFFADGYSRFDVRQGELGDCWILAALASLTLYRKLFFQVVPADQGFDKDYAGIFHFRFWILGRWIDIVIDDRVPTEMGALVYLRTTKDNKFWSVLLQKAYAKLHGSYEALDAGIAYEAMENFTGGVQEVYCLTDAPLNLFNIILKSYERCSLMSCALKEDPDVVEAVTAEGLVRGHAYSITKVKYVDIHTPSIVGKILLLRIRNPWGNEAEWNGAWSDKSPEWRFISDKEKQKIGLTFDEDGEFWMSFKDFTKHFYGMDICNLPPDLLTEEGLIDVQKKKWEISIFEGEWVCGVTAGGCRNYMDTFWMNPQYRVTLTDPDEDDGDNRCTVIVSLMQRDVRIQMKTEKLFLPIGVDIYYIANPDRKPKHLDYNFFSHCEPIQTVAYSFNREACARFRLPPGTYCIVPTTFEPDKETEFVLRVFSEHKNNIEENDEEFEIDVADTSSQEPIAVKKNVPTTHETQDEINAKELFVKLAGEDMEIDWMDLKQILDQTMQSELSESGFSKDVCRSMVAMNDTTKTGKLGFSEFRELWVDIRNWKLVFKTYDEDNSGALCGVKLRNAFTSAGYHLNNHILNILMHRYGSTKRVIEFDDFIMCAIKLKTMMRIFKEKDLANSNTADFNTEEWIENTLYA